MKRLVAMAALALLLTGCAAEVDPLIEDEIDSAWQTYVFHRQGEEPERPDVPIVKVIEYDEQNAKWAECVSDAGYETDLDADGKGFSIDNGGDPNSDDSLLALYICQASYPYDPTSIPGWPTSAP